MGTEMGMAGVVEVWWDMNLTIMIIILQFWRGMGRGRKALHCMRGSVRGVMEDGVENGLWTLPSAKKRLN
jgi:hypothetical protein